MASMEVKIIIASNQGVKPSCSLVQRLLQTTRYKYQLKSDKSSPILTLYHPKDKSDQTQLFRSARTSCRRCCCYCCSIERGQPLANDHPEGPTPCKWLSRGTSLLQMIIWRGRPLANDYPEGSAFCKSSSRGPDLLQIIIQRGWPLANDPPEGPASCI